MVVAASKPDPVDVHVGARLRLRRLQVGMNQGALARAIKVTFQQVQKYERGANRLSASRLYRCARTLGVPPAYFFEGMPDDEDGFAAGSDGHSPSTPLVTAQSLELASLLPDMCPKVRGALLGLARALALDPQILLLDEPTAGLDPITSAEIGQLIVELKKKRAITALVVTHDVHGAKAFSDLLILLDQGRIVAQGTFEELRNSKDEFVIRFLGKG